MTPETGRDDRRFAVALLLLTLAAAALRTFGLHTHPPTADDVGVVASAFDFVERGQFGTTMWQHPKLRSILAWASIRLLGDGPLGLRAPSLLLGTLCVPLVALLARRVTGSRRVALLAAFFTAVDAVHVDFSREAVQEVHVPFFVLGGVVAALASEARGRSLGLAIASGVMFGLGVSSKWSAAFPLAVVLGHLSWRMLAEPALRPAAKARELALLAAALVAVPLAVHLLTWLPWFLHRGYDLADWVAVQRAMAAENVSHTGFSPYLMEIDSWPALWFVKPVAFADFVLIGGRPLVFLAISNPLVWMATLPAAAWAIARIVRVREPGAVLLSALFWGSYVPLVLVGRPIWVNSSFAVTPFAFVLVAWAADAVAARRPRLLPAYLAAVLALAVPLYVLTIGAGYETPLLRPIVEQFRPAHER
jgi:dolichyl-phosphate-mannose-protein mannosyltransferase